MTLLGTLNRNELEPILKLRHIMFLTFIRALRLVRAIRVGKMSSRCLSDIL